MIEFEIEIKMNFVIEFDAQQFWNYKWNSISSVKFKVF